MNLFQFKPKWQIAADKAVPKEPEQDCSLFKAPITTIVKLENHPGADRLDLAYIYGFQVIVQKGKYQVGDRILYVPIDSIIPEWLDAKLFPLGSKIKLDKRRVRQIRIRKIASQGMLVDLQDIAEKVNPQFLQLEQDLSKILDIQKYEPPQRKERGQKGQTPRNRPLENPRFHKYGGIDNIKWYPSLFDEKEVVIQEKLHGCLRNYEQIELTDGSQKSIQEIVENKLPVEIWGLDLNKNKIIPTKVIGWSINGKTKDWLKIKYTKNNAGRGNAFRTLEVTPEHKIWTPEIQEYIEAKNLKPGFKVSFKRYDYDLNYVQEQILIGKMLGDGSLVNNYISFGHMKEQEKYLDYTLQCLGDLAGNKDKPVISGFGSTIIRGKTRASIVLQEYFSDWFINNTKQFPNSFVNKLNPIALAFWYMDDGSLASNPNQENRANFAICSFDDNSTNNLIEALKRFDIQAVSYKNTSPSSNKELNRLRLNADDAEKFFLLIAQYIPPIMRYKLPERYRNAPFMELPIYTGKYKNKLVEQEIISVEAVDPQIHKNFKKYDIETETHNFFINGILVHNSNCRASYAKTVPNTLWKRVKKLLGLLPDYEYCYGSNNVQLQEKTVKSGYYEGDVYGDVLKKVDAFKKLKPGETIFGELIGPGIQKGYGYGHDEHHFVLFDVKREKEDGTQEYLDPEEVESYAKERGFDFVPVLYSGIYNQELAKILATGPSVYYSEEKVKEGVVVKIRTGYGTNGSKQALKMINEAYLDDQSNTENH